MAAHDAGNSVRTNVMELMMSAPTRYPNGITNAASRTSFGRYGLPNPISWHEYHNDFDAYTAAGFVVTAVGTTPTAALTNEDGGVLLLTTSTGATDSIFLQKVGESFSFTPGQPLLFSSRIALSDATASAMVMGLQITDTTPLAVSDGVYFIKNTGAATVDFILAKASALTTQSAVATMVNATYITLAYYYDGKSEVQVFVNDAKVFSQTVLTNLPTVTVTPSWGIQNGAAAAKTMKTDWIVASKQRVF